MYTAMFYLTFKTNRPIPLEMLKRKKIVIEVRNLVLGIKKKLKSLVSHIVNLSENSLCYEATGAAM